MLARRHRLKHYKWKILQIHTISSFADFFPSKFSNRLCSNSKRKTVFLSTRCYRCVSKVHSTTQPKYTQTVYFVIHRITLISVKVKNWPWLAKRCWKCWRCYRYYNLIAYTIYCLSGLLFRLYSCHSSGSHMFLFTFTHSL